MYSCLGSPVMNLTPCFLGLAQNKKDDGKDMKVTLKLCLFSAAQTAQVAELMRFNGPCNFGNLGSSENNTAWATFLNKNLHANKCSTLLGDLEMAECEWCYMGWWERSHERCSSGEMKIKEMLHLENYLICMHWRDTVRVHHSPRVCNTMHVWVVKARLVSRFLHCMSHLCQWMTVTSALFLRSPHNKKGCIQKHIEQHVSHPCRGHAC